MVHMLEQESACYFNMKYFEEQVLAGEWDEVEHYLSCFTIIKDNLCTMKMFYEIRKQKYLEALDRQDRHKAVEILVNDLKVFNSHNQNIYEELAQLIPLENIRECERLSRYGDTTSTQKHTLEGLIKLIEKNPRLHNKLAFPHLQDSRLKNIINQSHFNMEFLPLVVIACLLQDVWKILSLPCHVLWWIMAQSVFFHLKMQVTYTGPPHPLNMYLQDDLPTKVAITLNQGSEVISMYSLDDLPMKVARSLNQGVEVTSMDFHPRQHTILLVGTSTGDIGIWNVGSGKKFDQIKLSFWDVSYSTMKMQAARVVDQPAASVNRCIWSPDGARVGVAFSKDIIQTYSYIGDGKLRRHLETNAHIGGLNDIAFGCHDEQIFVITCGDDKSIKVWDFVTGHRRYIFEGHEAPVYCILTQLKENAQFIFSTAIDGKIKGWMYDHTESILDCDLPWECHITLAYSADGSRLFSCVTRKGGGSYLVEWNEKDGEIKRTYSGFGKHPFEFGTMKFDTTRNRFLAAGDDRQIKFWDMDNVNILTTTEFEEGCLEASPRIRFNKESFEGTRVRPEALVTKASIKSPVAVLNATIPLSDTGEHLERILPTVLMGFLNYLHILQ